MLLTLALSIVSCHKRVSGTTVLSPSTTVAVEIGPNGSTPPGWGTGTIPTSTTTSGNVPKYQHVIIVAEENAGFSTIYPSGMPNADALANQYAYTNNYFANEHGSLSDYLFLVLGNDGSQFGCNGDNCGSANTVGTITDDNLVREMTKAGLTWKAYQEDIPSVGSLVYESGAYVRRHNPFPFLSDVANTPQQSNMVPVTQFQQDLSAGRLPALSFITPNNNNNGHDTGNYIQADNWLQSNVLGPLANSRYKLTNTTEKTLLILWFDEGDLNDGTNGGGKSFNLFAGPGVKTGGFASNTFYTHINMARTIIDALGLNVYYDGTANVPSMTDMFAGTPSNQGVANSTGNYPDTRPGAATVNYEPGYGVNVSGLDPHSLVYPGFNGLFLVHYLPWFAMNNCQILNGGIGNWSRTGDYCDPGHINITVNGYDPAYIKKEVDEVQRRHFDGFNILWEGVYYPGTVNVKNEEKAVQGFATEIKNRCNGGNCPVKFALMEDTSAAPGSDGFAGGHVGNGGASGGGGFAAQCCGIGNSQDENLLLTHYKDDLCYMNQNYFGNPAYIKINGRPLLSFFAGESGNVNGTAPSWADLWTQLSAFAQNLPGNCSFFNSQIYGNEPNNGIPWIEVSDGGAGNFNHDGLTVSPTGTLNGAFAWDLLDGNNQGISGQSANVQTGINGYNSFLQTAQGHQGNEVMGAAWPGFDDQMAQWSPNFGNCGVGSYCPQSSRVQDRACGMTWINSLSQAGQFYNSGKQLPFMQVVTWNDYDEGTEIQTGIDNCYRISASINGTSVSWTLNSQSPAANLATVDHFTVYGSLDQSNLFVLADGIKTATGGSFDLSTAALSAGTYTIYVKMWGKNSIINQSATAGTFTTQGTVSGGGGLPGSGGGVNPPASPGINPSPISSTGLGGKGTMPPPNRVRKARAITILH